MYFKKLEIFGFKSFADKTVLNFDEGITAVVGPNGCGKSNVFDSIRWVLGEQSMKELRGSTKEDVIFNGTDKKPPLGFAEVSLTFDNEKRMLPVEYDEVTITRRLFRSGESEYLLNRSNVRLKDIQEMLMGTGIGTQAYSMIQQGKVDRVVNAKPEDRRQILDEASGITKYKAKKKEALNKLKGTEDNLLRVNDITTEVKRQIASSERQANKARRYKEEYEKLKNLEVKLGIYEIDSLDERTEKLKNELQRLQQQQNDLNSELNEFNDLIEHETNHLADLDQKINDIRAEDIRLGSQLDLSNRQIGFNQERIENLQATKVKISQQKENLTSRCQEQQEKIAILKESLSEVESVVEANESQLNERKGLLSSLESSIDQMKSSIKDQEEKILALTSKQMSLRNGLTDSMKEIQSCIARQRRLELDDEKTKREKEQIDQKFQNTEYQLKAVQGVISELTLNREEVERRFNQTQSELTGLDQNITNLERKQLFLKSQKEFIEKLNTQYQDMPDPIIEGRFITSTAPEDHHTGIIGKVKEVIKKEQAGGGFFNQNNTAQSYEIVCETKFIELDPKQMAVKIDMIDGQLNELNEKRVSLVVVIDQIRVELEQVDSQLYEKEKTSSVLNAQRKDIAEEREKIMSELEAVQVELTEVIEQLESGKKKEEQLNYELDTITQDIVGSQSDIKDKQLLIAQKSQEREQLSVAVAQLETEIKSYQNKVKMEKDNYDMFCSTLDSWLDEIKKIDEECLSCDAKTEEYTNETCELQQKIESVRQTKDELVGSLAEYETQKADITQRVASVRANVESTEEVIDKLKQDVHEKQMVEQELSFGSKGVKDRLLQSYKINLDEYIANQQTEEISLLDAPQDQIVEVGGADMPEAQAQQEVFNFEEATLERDRLRKRCDSMGSVNLVAIEEYEELKERFEFLTKQQSDLLEAKSQLMSTINKINRSTRQMFMETFTKVSEEFRIYFRMLFGGGEADLVLLDHENVLESGIDIVARPPGKKLQNITLLSGGEKTLTAIALIFGVFKVNPSPFCVLDEIDAALDESNVGRFAYLLKDFAKVAQFIVITHNKKTISNADAMYGVTMPETGCSRIVSVKFAKEEQESKEPATAGV